MIDFYSKMCRKSVSKTKPHTTLTKAKDWESSLLIWQLGLRLIEDPAALVVIIEEDFCLEEIFGV
jgi:hypothetical protein